MYSKTKIKILFFTDYIIGGAETQLLFRIRTIKNKDYSILKIFYHDKREVELVNQLRKENVIINKLNLANYSSLLNIDNYLMVKKLIEKEKPAKVICYWGNSLSHLVGLVIKNEFPSIDLIVEVQNGVRETFYDPIQALLFDIADVIVSCSYNEAKLINKIFGINENKITVIQNSIKVKKNIRQKSYYGFNLTMIARFNEQKDHLSLIKAVKILKDKGYKIKLSLIGAGELLVATKKIVERLNLDDSVKFYGFIKNVYSVLNKTDLFCLVSNFEALPVTILEAMSLGIPVLASDVNGVSEIIKDGKNGFLLEENSPENISKKIIEIVKNKQCWEQISKNGIKTIENEFNIQKKIKKINNLYFGNIEKEIGFNIKSLSRLTDILLVKKRHRQKINHFKEKSLIFIYYVITAYQKCDAEDFNSATNLLIEYFSKYNFYKGTRIYINLFILMIESNILTENSLYKTKIIKLYQKEKVNLKKNIMLFLRYKKNLHKFQLASRIKNYGLLGLAEAIFLHITNDEDYNTEELVGKSYYHLGEIYLKRKNKIKAKKMFANCLKLYPKHENALKYQKKL